MQVRPVEKEQPASGFSGSIHQKPLNHSDSPQVRPIDQHPTRMTFISASSTDNSLSGRMHR
jgi:hypothetical protein